MTQQQWEAHQEEQREAARRWSEERGWGTAVEDQNGRRAMVIRFLQAQVSLWEETRRDIHPHLGVEQAETQLFPVPLNPTSTSQ